MTVPDELLSQYDLDYSKGRPNCYVCKIDWSQDVILVDDEAGLDAGSTATLDDRNEYPEVTQADLDRATFRIGLKIPVPNAADGGRGHDGDPDATRGCEHDDATPSTPEWLKVAESVFEFWDNPIDAAYDGL
mgnify:CR=1 FL=1|jgi:hypothetical protein